MNQINFKKKFKADIKLYADLYQKTEVVAMTHLWDWFVELGCSHDKFDAKLVEVLWQGKNEKCNIRLG